MDSAQRPGRATPRPFQSVRGDRTSVSAASSNAASPHGALAPSQMAAASTTSTTWAAGITTPNRRPVSAVFPPGDDGGLFTPGALSAEAWPAFGDAVATSTRSSRRRRFYRATETPSGTARSTAAQQATSPSRRLRSEPGTSAGGPDAAGDPDAADAADAEDAAGTADGADRVEGAEAAEAAEGAEGSSAAAAEAAAGGQALRPLSPTASDWVPRTTASDAPPRHVSLSYADVARIGNRVPLRPSPQQPQQPPAPPPAPPPPFPLLDNVRPSRSRTSATGSETDGGVHIGHRTSPAPGSSSSVGEAEDDTAHSADAGVAARTEDERGTDAATGASHDKGSPAQLHIALALVLARRRAEERALARAQAQADVRTQMQAEARRWVLVKARFDDMCGKTCDLGFSDSPFLPQSVAEYEELERLRSVALFERAARRLRQLPPPPPPPPPPDPGAASTAARRQQQQRAQAPLIADGLSSVLARATVFVPQPRSSSPPPWPSPHELARAGILRPRQLPPPRYGDRAIPAVDRQLSVHDMAPSSRWDWLPPGQRILARVETVTQIQPHETHHALQELLYHIQTESDKAWSGSS